MLDENLPCFQFRAGSDGAASSVIYFTQSGTEPSPEYVLKRADPASQPACRSRYGAALIDPHHADVVYGEVVVSPEWQQPTLSAAELRNQTAASAPPLPTVPDTFTIQLYNPDQAVTFKMVAGGWGKSDSWEFEMPTQSFRRPSTSQLDRQQHAPPASDLTPKIMLRWKRDGRLTKDMTCYLAGRSLGHHKSKEPDITIALFKVGRESSLTVYEPNLQRVEIEDRKGLDIILLLGAEVIRDLYLVPRHDLFNITSPGALTLPPSGNARKYASHKTPTPAASARPTATGAFPVLPETMMSGAIGVSAPIGTSSVGAALSTGDLETLRLQLMVDREAQLQAEQEREERDRRDRAEQKRIKRMLELEDEERRCREAAEIARETERLRTQYGTDGQDLPSARPGLPPRPAVHGQSPPTLPARSGSSSSPARPGGAGRSNAARHDSENGNPVTWWSTRSGPAPASSLRPP